MLTGVAIHATDFHRFPPPCFTRAECNAITKTGHSTTGLPRTDLFVSHSKGYSRIYFPWQSAFTPAIFPATAHFAMLCRADEGDA